MKKNKGISIYLMQVLLALIPLAVGAALLTVVAVTQLNKNMEESVYERLEIAATGAADYFEYDVQKREPDVQKAKQILGFTADTSLSDTLDEVIPWVTKQIDLGNI